MNLTEETKRLCKLHDIHPTKNKGQNFLVNKDVINSIVSAADLRETDEVLEVGPGLGILTQALVKNAKHVTSVELDEKLYNFLKTQFLDVKNLDLINQDILKFEPAEMLQKATSHDVAYKIVANLPYTITSYFLRRFISIDPSPEMMVLMLQKEVAKRICAKPGAFSLLAVSIQLYAKPSIVQIVPRSDFFPQPDVDSAVIKLDKIKTLDQVTKWLDGLDQKDFWRVVKVGFSAKRKQLHNNLSSGFHLSSEESKSILTKSNLDPSVRAQSLSLEDWRMLAKNVIDKLKK